MKHTNIIALNGSNASSITGSAIDSVELYRASFQASMGDATGAATIVIQASNDICTVQYNPSIFTPTNWTTISTLTFTAASTPLITPVLELSYRWLRVVFTETTPGTSTVTVTMFAVAV